MANKRDAKFLDAQNFSYELNAAWVKAYENMKEHQAENGKDTRYYVLLGIQEGLLKAKGMAEDFVNGKYAVKYD